MTFQRRYSEKCQLEENNTLFDMPISISSQLTQGVMLVITFRENVVCPMSEMRNWRDVDTIEGKHYPMCFISLMGNALNFIIQSVDNIRKGPFSISINC